MQMILSIPALFLIAFSGDRPRSIGPKVYVILMTILTSLTLLFYFIISSVRQKSEWVWLLFVLTLNLLSFVLSYFRSLDSLFFLASYVVSLVAACLTILTVLVVLLQGLCCDSCCKNTPGEGASTGVVNNSSATNPKDDGANLHTSTVKLP